MLFLQSLLPRVAGKLDVAAISDVIDIESDDTFIRTIYAGNAILRVQSTDPLKIVTVRVLFGTLVMSVVLFSS